MAQRRLKGIRKRQGTKDKSNKNASFSYVPRKFKGRKYSVLKGRESYKLHLKQKILQNRWLSVGIRDFHGNKHSEKAINRNLPT